MWKMSCKTNCWNELKNKTLNGACNPNFINVVCHITSPQTTTNCLVASKNSESRAWRSVATSSSRRGGVGWKTRPTSFHAEDRGGPVYIFHLVIYFVYGALSPIALVVVCRRPGPVNSRSRVALVTRKLIATQLSHRNSGNVLAVRRDVKQPRFASIYQVQCKYLRYQW